MKVDPRRRGVVYRAEQLPVAVSADAKPADIAIGGQAEAVAEIVVVAPGDQRIDPAGGTIEALSGQYSGVQGHVGREPPGAETGTQIRELARLVEDAVEQRRGPRVGDQPRIAAAE